MNIGINSPGAAAANCNMKYSGCVKNNMRDHGGAMIVINIFIPPLSFMLRLAAAAPGLFMPLFMLLLKIIFLSILVSILVVVIITTVITVSYTHLTLPTILRV